jgi:hypothetical protein
MMVGRILTTEAAEAQRVSKLRKISDGEFPMIGKTQKNREITT